jgi:hypothetical protein
MPESNQLLPSFRPRASYRKTQGLAFAPAPARPKRGPCGHDVKSDMDGLDAPVREPAQGFSGSYRSSRENRTRGFHPLPGLSPS